MYNLYKMFIMFVQQNKNKDLIMDTATGKNPVKPKRSVDLEESEKALLKGHIARYAKPVDAAIALGIDRNTMQRVDTYGSGAQASIEKIRHSLKILYPVNA